MIFGKKSDLKNHLSTKKPTWAHKVVAHSTLEQNPAIDRHEDSPPERNPTSEADRSEPIQPRY
jgi:hypothetical protein